MHHASSVRLSTKKQTEECHRGQSEEGDKENPGLLHQRQDLEHSTPRMVYAEECHSTSFTFQMEMSRTCRKASPHQMGAGNNYVGPLQRQEKQRQAKHQMGRLFQQTSGITLFQSGEGQK